MTLESQYYFSLLVFLIKPWLKAVVLCMGASPQVASKNTFRVKAHKAVTVLAPCLLPDLTSSLSPFLTSLNPHWSPCHFFFFEQAKDVLLQSLSVFCSLWNRLFWTVPPPSHHYLESSIQVLSWSERPFLISICKIASTFLPCLPFSTAAALASTCPVSLFVLLLLQENGLFLRQGLVLLTAVCPAT